MHDLHPHTKSFPPLCTGIPQFCYSRLTTTVAAEPDKALDAIYMPASWWKVSGVIVNLVAYVDGGSLGNPGPSGIGVVLDRGDGTVIEIARWIGRQDNNVAEYIALLEALQCAVALKARALHVYSDSQVVVRQMKGEYNCRSPRLYSLNWICRKLARSFRFSISHIPRDRNTEANRLANSAAHSRRS